MPVDYNNKFIVTVIIPSYKQNWLLLRIPDTNEAHC